MRTTADGRIMMGGEDEPLTTHGARTRRIPPKTRALLAKFERWFPDLDLAVSRSWAGAFAVTADGLGYVDQSAEYANTWFVIGAGGNGMIFSVIAAQILEDVFRGKANRDAHLFRFDRPWNRHRTPRL
jgi:glycine/D-amino acid oxidase-like deaminating enzyme